MFLATVSFGLLKRPLIFSIIIKLTTVKPSDKKKLELNNDTTVLIELLESNSFHNLFILCYQLLNWTESTLNWTELNNNTIVFCGADYPNWTLFYIWLTLHGFRNGLNQHWTDLGWIMALYSRIWICLINYVDCIYIQYDDDDDVSCFHCFCFVLVCYSTVLYKALSKKVDLPWHELGKPPYTII